MLIMKKKKKKIIMNNNMDLIFFRIINYFVNLNIYINKLIIMK